MDTQSSQEKRILNCLPSLAQDRDWTDETATYSGVGNLRDSFPDSVDLREDWWAINNQFSTGSCVGWATADSVLRWHFTKANKLDIDEKLAIRFIWMAAKETDVFTSRPTSFIENAGTSLKAALDIARYYGCVKENVLPFNSITLYSGKADPFYALASEFKIRGYYNLSRGNKLNIWKSWIANQGPILTRLDVDEEWYKATQNKGVLKNYQFEGFAGHAVALVGYTPDYFIVRNSWGENWGDGGFAYAHNDYALKAFSEAYGVSLNTTLS